MKCRLTRSLIDPGPQKRTGTVIKDEGTELQRKKMLPSCSISRSPLA